MKLKIKYSILFIATLAFIFLIYSSIKWRYWELEYLLFAKVLFVIGILSLVLYFIAKDWRKVLTVTMLFSFSVCLTLSVYLSHTYMVREKSLAIMTKYESANCKELEEYFKTDLQNDEIKFFQYGMGPNMGLDKTLKSKYGIELYGMGCVKLSTIDCYNNLVSKYLKEEYNDSIIYHLN